MFALTVTSKNGQTETGTQYFRGDLIQRIRPTTLNNTATAARFEYLENGENVTYSVSETAAAVAASVTTDMAEAGAELTANKDATGGYAGLTLFKINFKNALNTFTSFFTNANTAARTYTFQDRNGTIADDTDLALKAPLASPTLTGVPAAPTAAAGTNTTQLANTAFVEARAKQTPFGTSASTADTYVATLSPAVTLATGLSILIKCTNANTGAATLEIDGTGPIAIKRRDGSTALSAADIPAGKYVRLFFDGTNWVMENVG